MYKLRKVDKMNRRNFLVGAAGAALSTTMTDRTLGMGIEFHKVGAFELRKYSLKNMAQAEMLHNYLKDAFIPVAKKLGCGPIGVFEQVNHTEIQVVHVLIPHRSVATAFELNQKLSQSKEHLEKGEAFWKATPANAPYDRYESSLMSPFHGMDHLETPDVKSQRIFELRTYESHNDRAGFKKVDMFNIGEIDLFRKAGLNPVFFGQTIIGSHLPNLTYMLTYPDMAAHDAAWKKFIADPEWKKLSKTPGYTDPEIVSHINNWFLSPTAYSQI